MEFLSKQEYISTHILSILYTRGTQTPPKMSLQPNDRLVCNDHRSNARTQSQSCGWVQATHIRPDRWSSPPRFIESESFVIMRQPTFGNVRIPPEGHSRPHAPVTRESRSFATGLIFLVSSVKSIPFTVPGRTAPFLTMNSIFQIWSEWREILLFVHHSHRVGDNAPLLVRL
jgi:hypothetical protein